MCHFCCLHKSSHHTGDLLACWLHVHWLVTTPSSLSNKMMNMISVTFVRGHSQDRVNPLKCFPSGFFFLSSSHFLIFITAINGQFVLCIVVCKNLFLCLVSFQGCWEFALVCQCYVRLLRSQRTELIGHQEGFSKGQIDLNLIAQAFDAMRRFSKTFSRTL